MPEPITVQCSSCQVSLSLDWDPIDCRVVAKRDGKEHADLTDGIDPTAIDICQRGG